MRSAPLDDSIWQANFKWNHWQQQQCKKYVTVSTAKELSAGHLINLLICGSLSKIISDTILPQILRVCRPD